MNSMKTCDLDIDGADKSKIKIVVMGVLGCILMMFLAWLHASFAAFGILCLNLGLLGACFFFVSAGIVKYSGVKSFRTIVWIGIILAVTGEFISIAGAIKRFIPMLESYPLSPVDFIKYAGAFISSASYRIGFSFKDVGFNMFDIGGAAIPFLWLLETALMTGVAIGGGYWGMTWKKEAEVENC